MDLYQLPDNTIISSDQAFAVGGIKYPSGWIRDLSEAAITGMGLTAYTAPVTEVDVNIERDRRLADNFTFNGTQFQRDATSLARITGAATLAGFAMGAGAPVGYLRWANPDRDFEWIAADDTRMPMDAQTAFAFGQAAAHVETTLIFAASTLRNMTPIPTDYTNDIWWTV